MNKKVFFMISVLFSSGVLFGAAADAAGAGVAAAAEVETAGVGAGAAAEGRVITEWDIEQGKTICEHRGEQVPALFLNKGGYKGTIEEVLNDRTLATISMHEGNRASVVISFADNELMGNVPSNFVQSCHNVEVFDLSDNSITGIQPGAFNGANRLQWVILKGNRIKRLEKDTIKRVLGLWGLDLSNNDIEEIDPEALKMLRFLNVLNLSNNKIRILKPGQFAFIRVQDEFDIVPGQSRPYPNGTDEDFNHKYAKPSQDALEINLSGNPIEEVELGALDNLPHLRKLTIKNEPPLSEDLQAKIMSMVPVDCECTF